MPRERLMPISVKLTLEGMQQSIIQYLHEYQGDLQESMEEAVRQTITSFDFDSEVKSICKQEMSRLVAQVIKNTLLYDDEARELIKQLVVNSLKRSIENGEEK